MVERFKLLENPDSLKKTLSKNPLENAPFIYWAFESEQKFDCYLDESQSATLAIEKGGENHVVFTGNWHNRRLPIELLPKDGFFVSACPSDVMNFLTKVYKIVGGLMLEEIPVIANHWDLSDEPEPHIRKCIEQFESVCVRVNDKPVSWAGIHFEIDKVANMGFAHTLKEERRKGYATLVTKALVNRVVARGKKAICHILKDNKVSITLCERLGFTRIGEVTWAEVGPLLD
jgi:ribosomal protein S18 acetylase RimI-like enzyme